MQLKDSIASSIKKINPFANSYLNQMGDFLNRPDLISVGTVNADSAAHSSPSTT